MYLLSLIMCVRGFFLLKVSSFFSLLSSALLIGDSAIFGVFSQIWYGLNLTIYNPNFFLKLKCYMKVSIKSLKLIFYSQQKITNLYTEKM